jgi:hypothetical protein
MSCVQVVLVLFNFDFHGSNLVVEHAVASDLPGIAPISSVGHCFLKDLKIPAWACEHVMKPHWEWFEW